MKTKDFIDKILALLFLIITIPFWPIFYILIKSTSSGSFIFKQKRMGKNGKTFTLYKIRTMVEDAEKIKKNYRHLNEADGPVFKIKNDPRFTSVGKFLANVGLDELPQLLNVVRGEMALVGPRPLPVKEAKKIPKKYEKRFSILPGITSLWVIKGAHSLSFENWMRYDLEYLSNKSLIYNFKILFSTGVLLLKLVSFRIFKK